MVSSRKRNDPVRTLFLKMMNQVHTAMNLKRSGWIVIFMFDINIGREQFRECLIPRQLSWFQEPPHYGTSSHDFSKGDRVLFEVIHRAIELKERSVGRYYVSSRYFRGSQCIRDNCVVYFQQDLIPRIHFPPHSLLHTIQVCFDCDLGRTLFPIKSGLKTPDTS